MMPSWVRLVLKMDRTENSHGCGYYNSDAWLDAYKMLKALAYNELRKTNHMKRNHD